VPRGRAFWSGAISFGLVNVPVKLFTAVRSHDIRFNQLERETGARIRYKKVSERTGEEVPAEDIVKGFEVGPGHYVVIEPEELTALAPKASHTIDLTEFVDLAEVDPLFFDQPYYLVPDKGGAKAYKLLVDVMARTRRVAVGRLILRAKEHLVAIRPLEGVLCLETLRFADEVVPAAEIAAEAGLDGVEVSDRELTMAEQLVESLVEKWNPDKYVDEYRDQIRGLIDAKASGQEIIAQPATEPSAKVLDLMAALEASIAARKVGASSDTETTERRDEAIEQPEAGSSSSDSEAGDKEPSRKKRRTKKLA
jgi:DNA end-binding protein Ku